MSPDAGDPRPPRKRPPERPSPPPPAHRPAPPEAQNPPPSTFHPAPPVNPFEPGAGPRSQGTITPHGKNLLVISQSWPVHEQIELFLAELRKHHKK